MNNLKFLKFKSTDQLWFFSDPHFGHKNICLGTTNWQGENRKNCRDFTTVEEMDATIINNINNMVGLNDILFCLGDWCFAGENKIAEYRSRIVCQNLHLVLGNHDKDIRQHEKHQHVFSSVRDYLEINVDEQHVIMQHFPIESWNRMHRGSYHFFGHQHLPASIKLRPGKKIDVGVDGNNFQPYSWKELDNLLKDRVSTVDHHHKDRQTMEM